jgi:hypothetical protein
VNPARWLWNWLVVIDLFLNTIILCSHDTETLSKRAAKARDKGKRWGCIVCRWLDRVKANHCTDALTGP